MNNKDQKGKYNNYNSFFRGKEEIIFLEHTADAEFIVFARSLRTLFELSMQAVFSIMFDIKEIKSVMKKKVVVESESLAQLLFDFLNELLVIFDSEFFIPVKISSFKHEYNNNTNDKSKRAINKVIVEVQGDDSKKYKPKGNDVKAITYHNYIVNKIRVSDETWYYCHIIVDI